MQRLPYYRTTTQQAATLTRMAPRGDGWRPRAGSRGYRFWTAIAAEVRRIRGLIVDIMLVEAIPSDTPPYDGDYGPVHTLAAWESDLGIIAPDGAIASQRAVAVVTRLGATGGVTPAYFTSIASLAQNGTATPPPTWLFAIHEFPMTYAAVFDSATSLSTEEREAFEAAMNAIRPLHLMFIFSYTL